MDPSTGTENPKQTTPPDSYAAVSPDAKGVGTVVNDPEPIDEQHFLVEEHDRRLQRQGPRRPRLPVRSRRRGR
ncbi:hypothetical protein [Streptomyces canus]|uniref:hypothetical protein n=1 Tax=Streptomyces canus TaxID=58343 RepID=UPI003AF3FC06